MLDESTQLTELLALERRTAWGGKESVDHPQISGAHDDAINALAGAAVLAAAVRRSLYVSDKVLARSAQPFGAIAPSEPSPSVQRGRLWISLEVLARSRQGIHPTDEEGGSIDRLTHPGLR